jgi:hypothetical protein
MYMLSTSFTTCTATPDGMLLGSWVCCVVSPLMVDLELVQLVGVGLFLAAHSAA